MRQPARITWPVQLVVEGNDQRNFFGEFVERMSLTGVQIQNFGGVSELPEFLAALANEPEFDDVVERLGVVRDAETNADGAFESVQSALENAGLPRPERPEEFAEGRPAVVALVLPGGGRTGMLETLVCESFAHEPVNRCIDEFFECVGEASIRNPDKARAFAYLTTTSEPRHSVGVAAQQGQWDLDHSAFDGVRRFLEELGKRGSNGRIVGCVVEVSAWNQELGAGLRRGQAVDAGPDGLLYGERRMRSPKICHGRTTATD